MNEPEQHRHSKQVIEWMARGTVALRDGKLEEAERLLNRARWMEILEETDPDHPGLKRAGDLLLLGAMEKAGERLFRPKRKPRS